MKKCEYEKVSEGAFLWFTQQRDKGMSIHRPDPARESSDFAKGI
jgi:hypothetical protein